MKKIIYTLVVAAGPVAVQAQDTFYAALQYGSAPASIASRYAGPVLVPGNLLSTGGGSVKDMFTIDGSSISITNEATFAAAYSASGYAFNGIELDVASGYNLVAVSLNTGLTTFPGLASSAVTFNSTQIFVNLATLSTSPGSVIDLNITTVPEPSTLALAGLGAMAVVLRKRK